MFLMSSGSSNGFQNISKTLLNIPEATWNDPEQIWGRSTNLVFEGLSAIILDHFSEHPDIKWQPQKLRFTQNSDH